MKIIISVLTILLLVSCGGGDLKSVEAETSRYRPYVSKFDTESKRQLFKERLENAVILAMEVSHERENTKKNDN